MEDTHPFTSLKSAYNAFVDGLVSLPEPLFTAPIDGWSPRDITAHLIGWTRNMIEACSAILSGQTPAYYADAPNDYRNINAGFVAQYALTSRVEMLHELGASMVELERYILSLDPHELDESHGILHYSGRPATVAGIIASLAGDYRDHLDQIKTWLGMMGQSVKTLVLAEKSQSYLNALCSVRPNRRTGSPGNQQAADFFASTMAEFGLDLDTTPFACLDYQRGDSFLVHGGENFPVYVSPYSLGCDVVAELVSVSTVQQLENARCAGAILLMHGEICSEQLMPKNFVFYNPEHHQKLIALLEARQPAAIITATARNPELVGALYPFPLFVDGDFDIPSVYCTDGIGAALAGMQGEQFHLLIDAHRLPSQANNIVARLNPAAAQKIVITAHIDAYEDTPGALDNGSGTTVLLLLAELLAGYDGPYGIEIVAINGEDHYSAGGEMDYLKRYGDDLDRTLLAINLDDVGYLSGNSAFSFYGCPLTIQQRADSILQSFSGLASGEPWYQGDHMIFVQRGLPCIAFTSANMAELMQSVTHTGRDTPDLINHDRLVELAQAIDRLIRAL